MLFVYVQTRVNVCVGGCEKEEERGSVTLGHVHVEISPHTQKKHTCLDTYSGLQVYQHMHVRITGVT